jgi:hypothetical protein
MKLAEIAEGFVSRSSLRKDAQRSAVAGRAADLSALAQRVWEVKDLEQKKAAAREMASAFELGGQDKFLAAVNQCVSGSQVDKLAANAMLKGEGKGAKLY